jgi:hypothetical protein
MDRQWAAEPFSGLCDEVAWSKFGQIGRALQLWGWEGGQFREALGRNYDLNRGLFVI